MLQYVKFLSGEIGKEIKEFRWLEQLRIMNHLFFLQSIPWGYRNSIEFENQTQLGMNKRSVLFKSVILNVIFDCPLYSLPLSSHINQSTKSTSSCLNYNKKLCQL